MQRGPWKLEDDPLVGIAGAHFSEIDTNALESIVAERGGSSLCGDLETVLDSDPSVLIALGERTLTGAVRTGIETPMLPVDAGTGIGSVAASDLSSALETMFETGATVCRRPLLGARTNDGVVAHALFDVTLVTDEPAKISEFSVRTHGDSVARFRADGVVVATPAGSHGYTSAADGPLVAADLPAITAVPIAPFVTQARRWVLPDDYLEVTVERDESTVELRVDDAPITTVGEGSTIALGTDGWFPTLVVSESHHEFE